MREANIARRKLSILLSMKEKDVSSFTPNVICQRVQNKRSKVENYKRKFVPRKNFEVIDRDV